MTDIQTPTIVVGLDGAHWKLLEPFINKGLMPTFKQLRDQGAWGILTSTVPPLSAPAWAAFSTGMTPAGNGVFDWTVISRSSFHRTPMNSSTMKGERFWNTLSRLGATVGVVNVPLTYPPYTVNGYLITDWLTPSDEVDFTHPKELKEELKRQTGGYNIGIRSWSKYQNQGLDALIDDVLQIHESRIKNLLYLFETKKPNLMVSVFTGSDILQHTFYQVLDSSHPLHNQERAEKYLPKIERYFSMLDDFITQLMVLTENKVQWLFLSDHGFGALHKKVYVNRYLEEKGLFHFAKARKSFLDKTVPIAKRLGITRQRIQKIIGESNDYAKSSNWLAKMNRMTGSVNWEKTRIFAMATDGVFVNLKSRWRFGIVDDGEEYHRVREEAKDVLLKLRDPNGNRKVIDKVYYPEDLYSGPELKKAPDLFLEVTDGPYQLSHSFTPGTDEVFDNEEWQTGRHHRDGMIMLSGESIQPGHITGRIWDVAPTILHWMGFPIPDNMGGKPLLDAFTQEFQALHQIEHCTSVEHRMDDFHWSDDEKDELEKRLEGLGYLG